MKKHLFPLILFLLLVIGCQEKVAVVPVELLDTRLKTRVVQAPVESVVAESVQEVVVVDDHDTVQANRVFIEQRERRAADISINPTNNQLTLPRLSEGYGKALTPVYSVPMSERPIARIHVNEITANARIKVQVQEAEGNYESHDALTVYQAGQYEIDLSSVTGWTESRPFHIVIWLEGAGAEAALETFSIEANGQPLQEVVLSRQVNTVQTVNTESLQAVNTPRVNPRDGWLMMNTMSENHEEGCFLLAVDNLSVGYGKAETPLFSADLRQTPHLEFSVEEVGTDILYSVQLQEQFGDYRAFDIVKDMRGTNVFEVNLDDIYADGQWEGTREFRFVVWVAGQGVIHVGELVVNSDTLVATNG